MGVKTLRQFNTGVCRVGTNRAAGYWAWGKAPENGWIDISFTTMWSRLIRPFLIILCVVQFFGDCLEVVETSKVGKCLCIMKKSQMPASNVLSGYKFVDVNSIDLLTV
jgi:hypothetical protein